LIHIERQTDIYTDGEIERDIQADKDRKIIDYRRDFMNLEYIDYRYSA